MNVNVIYYNCNDTPLQNNLNNNLIVACDLVMFLIKSKAEICVENINCIILQ